MAGNSFGIATRDIDVPPVSYCSEFCVSTDKSGRDQRLLEQDARPLILAADYLVDGFPRERLAGRSLMIPVIVTTAPLYTLRYRPTEVSLETGAFTALDPKEIESIPWSASIRGSQPGRAASRAASPS
jgi:hypothetical protein